MYFSNSFILELPPDAHEVIDMENNLTDLVKISKVTDDMSRKERIKKTNILRFDDKPFFNKLPGLAANWDYMWYRIYFGEKIINIYPKDKNNSKCTCIHGSIIFGAGDSLLDSLNLNRLHR